MNKNPRLYINYGSGYQLEKANTLDKIVNRLYSAFNEVGDTGYIQYIVIEVIDDGEFPTFIGSTREQVDEMAERIELGKKNNLKWR